jgi:hypothetical protein
VAGGLTALYKDDADRGFGKSSSIEFRQSCDPAVQAMGKPFAVEFQSCCKAGKELNRGWFCPGKAKAS